MLEKQRTICYKKDGNSITYHNKNMRLVEGCVYCSEPVVESQWNSYCMIYVRYPEQKIAMEFGTLNADYSTEEVIGIVKKNGIETQDTFINFIKRKIEMQDHVQLIWIEYLKYICPTLIDDCWESRKACMKKREQIRQERNAKREAEDKAFLEERQAETEKLIAAAYETIRNGAYQNADGTYMQEFFDMVSDLEKRMNYAKEHTVLPPKPDYKRIEEFTMMANMETIRMGDIL